MKWRNSKERELLAAGGSREQTLPNKNNPNPDLSDADGDKPKLDLTDVQDISPVGSPLDHQRALDRESSNGLQMQNYQLYDHVDYDSSNDSDEEINVTWFEGQKDIFFGEDWDGGTGGFENYKRPIGGRLGWMI